MGASSDGSDPEPHGEPLHLRRKLSSTHSAHPKTSLPLSTRLRNDTLAAATATLGVAPLVCIVDKAIFSNASGKQPLGQCLLQGMGTLLRRPWTFLRLPEFQMIYGVYSFTYFSANVTDSWCKHAGWDPTWPVFLAATGANMGAGIAKDRAFARMFGRICAGQVVFARMFGRFFFVQDRSLRVREDVLQHTFLSCPRNT